jgi:hypothetical protein
MRFKSKKMKKSFDGRNLSCTFCKKKGHNFAACNSRQSDETNLPSDEFVKNLLAKPKTSLEEYEGLTLDQALDKLEKLGSDLNEGNPWVNSDDGASQLRKNLGIWKALGANDSVLTWLSRGIQLRFGGTPSQYEFPNPWSYREHYDFANDEIIEHLADGSFQEVKKSEVGVSNPQMVEVNAKGKKRRIDDLRYVNSYLPSMKFKMETPRKELPQVIARGAHLFVRDFEKAYYKVPMHPSSWKYLCFKHDDRYIQGTCLLFGLSLAPFFFTKICRPIAAFCRMLGINLLHYIDDFLFSAEPTKSNELMRFVTRLFKMLGWTMSPKAMEDPGVQAKFVGILINSERFDMQIPKERIDRAMLLINLMLGRANEGKPVTKRDVQILTGHALSMNLAIPCVRAWTRSLYRAAETANPKFRQRMHHAGPTPKYFPFVGGTMKDSLGEVVLPPEAVEELQVLRFLLEHRNSAPIMAPECSETVFVDTGAFAWGAHCNGTEAKGFLPLELIGTSSTAREMAGARFALCAFECLRGKMILMILDSTAAVRNFTKMGGPITGKYSFFLVCFQFSFG